MKNNSVNPESTPNLIPSLDISSVLAEPKVCKLFRKMYQISTVAMHESAFAVYNNQGKPNVSKIILPEITDLDLYSEISKNQRTSVDVSGLTKNPKYIEVDLYNEDTYRDVDLSESARRRIELIKKCNDFDGYGKEVRIERIIARERDKKSDITMYRNDVVLLCHNHPQPPLAVIHPDNVLCPSTSDLRGYEDVRSSSPNLIEGIVASDGNNHKIILYKAQEGVVTSPEEYDNRDVVDGYNYKKRLGSLAVCGYSYVVLELMKNGEVSKTSRRELEDFVSIQPLSTK